jgi:predicted nucleic acid-binding Zn finger protein
MFRIPTGAVATLAAVMVTCLATSPAHAQVALQAGVTINGSITDSDLTLTDKSKFDEYTYRGRRGEQVTITMRSSEFDTYLYIGRMTGDRWNLLTSDDDGGDGTNSRIVVVLPEDGQYLIRANALSADSRGRYTLTLQSGNAAPAGVTNAAAAVLPILPGQTLAGELGNGDAVHSDGSWYDTYTFTGRRGDSVRVLMRSRQFDTYLYVGRMVDGQWQSLASDDDSGGDTDSLIEIVLPADGEYVIRANALSDGDGGAYTLQLNVAGAGRMGDSGDPAPPRRAAATPTGATGM